MGPTICGSRLLVRYPAYMLLWNPSLCEVPVQDIPSPCEVQDLYRQKKIALNFVGPNDSIPFSILVAVVSLSLNPFIALSLIFHGQPSQIRRMHDFYFIWHIVRWSCINDQTLLFSIFLIKCSFDSFLFIILNIVMSEKWNILFNHKNWEEWVFFLNVVLFNNFENIFLNIFLVT